jgi:protein ERP2
METKMNRIAIVALILIVLTSNHLASGLIVRFRTIVKPLAYECFYQYFPMGVSLYNDVVVVSGTHATISYQIFHNGREIVNEKNRRTLWAKFDTNYEGEGEYSFCIDNGNTLVETKNVYFYLTSNDEFIDPVFANYTEYKLPSKEELGSELKERTKDIKRRVKMMRKKFDYISRLQSKFSEIMRVNSAEADRLNWTVDKWSIIGTCIMVMVSVIQVVVIKSLFEDKSRIERMLRGNKQRLGT